MYASRDRRQQTHKTNGAIDALGNSGQWETKCSQRIAARPDEARYALLQATTEGGRIAKVAKHVGQLCLPHFECEENTIFPILALLPYVAAESVRPEMLETIPLIAKFRAKQDTMIDHHQSILAAIEESQHTADKEKNRKVGEFAYNLRNHEDLEDEVIYSAEILIGNYLQERLTPYNHHAFT
jgi:hypothetical protein